MLRLSKNSFIYEYENLPSIDNQIQTYQPSTDWNLPARVLLAECDSPYTASESDNSDSESTLTESQAPLSLDRAQ